MSDALGQTRRAYQREVETLLEQIRRQARELQRLKVAGARGPALAGRKRELAHVRARLAEVTRGPAPYPKNVRAAS